MHKLLTFILSLQLLLASIGVTVNVHTCLITGKSIISLSFIADCCGTDNDDHDLKQWLAEAGCCTSEIDHQHVETESNTSVSSFKLSPLQYFTLATIYQFVAVKQQMVDTRINENLAYHTPLPKHGRQLLTANQTFLI